MKEIPIIEAKNLTLIEFINHLLSSNSINLFPNNCFPSNELFDEFLQKIHDYEEQIVLQIIERFLVHTGTYGHNEWFFKALMTDGETRKTFLHLNQNRTWFRRMVLGMPAWEGIQWVMDLLPYFPSDAINAIDSFFMASCQHLPDNAMVGLSNATSIIRARYLEYNHPIEIIQKLDPLVFEKLIKQIFLEKGYQASTTKSTDDGGVDVIAVNGKVTNKETIYIQCKKYTQNVGVKYVRELMGVVTDKRVTRGILCITSDFTKRTVEFAKRNSQIELICGNDLIRICNEIFGITWPYRINEILRGNN